MAESGRAPLFFSNRVPWGAMVVRATHAPFSESGSSKPTKLEEAMGACAVAVAGEEPCAVAPPGPAVPRPQASPRKSVPRTSALRDRPILRSQHVASRSTRFTASLLCGCADLNLAYADGPLASSNQPARSGGRAGRRQECWRTALVASWL